MRRVRGVQKGLVKVPHGTGEHLAGLGLASRRLAGLLTGHTANNLPDSLGVDTALLQNLAGQCSDLLSDGLVFVCPGRRQLSEGALGSGIGGSNAPL